ncbi:MAG: DUF3144 domain-containing protein [Chitinophagaceae bacterium]|nr:DUF3144 domain-containing protein [Chitinophagaceae bacterium]
MMAPDEKFFERADEHINLSNRQLTEASMGKVSASMMYSVARFNAWVSACGWKSGNEMEQHKEDTLKYFVEEYQKMLSDNLDEYIANFDAYMKPGGANPR